MPLDAADKAAIAFSGRYAYLADHEGIFSLDLVPGASRRIPSFSAEQLAVSADGALLGAQTGNMLVVVRRDGRRAVTEGPILAKTDVPRLVWDRNRLAVLGWNGGGVYDERLRLRGRLPSWGVRDAVGIGGRIAGVGDGALRVARIPRAAPPASQPDQPPDERDRGGRQRPQVRAGGGVRMHP